MLGNIDGVYTVIIISYPSNTSVETIGFIEPLSLE